MWRWARRGHLRVCILGQSSGVEDGVLVIVSAPLIEVVWQRFVISCRVLARGVDAGDGPSARKDAFCAHGDGAVYRGSRGGVSVGISRRLRAVGAARRAIGGAILSRFGGLLLVLVQPAPKELAGRRLAALAIHPGERGRVCYRAADLLLLLLLLLLLPPSSAP